MGVALPLHPEYRTLPMVWYVPPLSPILQRVTSDVYLPDAHEMRVPVQYLANLFTAGNTEILARTLQRVLDMREYMRRRETGERSYRSQCRFNRRSKCTVCTNCWHCPNIMIALLSHLM